MTILIINMLSYITAAVVLTLLPGPDNLYVVTESIINGRRNGIAIAVGLSLGIIIHTAAAAFGISIIIQQSTLAFQALQVVGALYIFYLAVLSWRDKSIPDANVEHKEENTATLVKRGFFMNVLNPKVALFFLAFLPQFIAPEVEAAHWQMIRLGSIFMIQALIIMSTFAIIAAGLRQYIKSDRFWKNTRYIKVFVLVVFGVLLLLASPSV